MDSEETPSSHDVRTGYIEGNTFRYKPVKYSVIDGKAIFEGDIILGTVEDMERLTMMIDMENNNIGMEKELAQACIITDNRFRWLNNIVPFTIDTNFPNVDRINDAINHWNENTNLRFVNRSNQSNFVTFTATSSGCSSHVGMQGGQQRINLESGCTAGNVIHEIGHAIGLWHEQSREDRDRFVRINFANIQSSALHNFDQHITDGDDVGDYDFNSIMHYPANAFSKNGLNTIDTLHGETIGQRTALSRGDIAAVNLIYPTTLNDTSIDGPALAYYNNRMYIAWTGTDGDHHLNVMSSADGKVFSNKVVLSDTSIARPALGVYNGKLYIAWAGTDGGNHLNVMSSIDGTKFNNKKVLNDNSKFSPSIASFKNSLYIAWTGTDSEHKLNVMRYTDGGSWGDKRTLGETSSHGPALASDNNYLYLGWTGTDSRHKLNVMSSADGKAFSNKVTLNETSIDGPALKYANARLHISWSGTDGQHRVNVMTSTDGKTFFDKIIYGHTSPYTPALSNGRVRAFLGWTGTDTHHRLNVMTI